MLKYVDKVFGSPVGGLTRMLPPMSEPLSIHVFQEGTAFLSYCVVSIAASNRQYMFKCSIQEKKGEQWSIQGAPFFGCSVRMLASQQPFQRTLVDVNTCLFEPHSLSKHTYGDGRQTGRTNESSTS